MKSPYAVLAVIGLGLTLAMHGEADDAPGVAFIGIVLIVGASTPGARRALFYKRGITGRGCFTCGDVRHDGR
jgi:hypothetical protein